MSAQLRVSMSPLMRIPLEPLFVPVLVAHDSPTGSGSIGRNRDHRESGPRTWSRFHKPGGIDRGLRSALVSSIGNAVATIVHLNAHAPRRASTTRVQSLRVSEPIPRRGNRPTVEDAANGKYRARRPRVRITVNILTG